MMLVKSVYRELKRKWTSLLITATVVLSIVLGSVDNVPLINKTKYSVSEDEEQVQEEALHRLLQVFGMQHPGRRERHHSPPQFMLDLYNTIADSSGITRTSHPYQSNIVRSFPDKDVSHHHHFFFNITSSVPEKEQLLEAEFHLYKLKPKPALMPLSRDTRSHLLEVRVYQIMSPKTMHKEAGNRLLDVRRMSEQSVGWEVFYVKPAVLDWIKDSTKNYGLLISVKNLLGKPVQDGMLRFAKRQHHPINKQPILVLFADDGRPKKSPLFPLTDMRNYGYPELFHNGLSLDPVHQEVENHEKTEEDDETSSSYFNFTDSNNSRKRRSVDRDNFVLEAAEEEQQENVDEVESPEETMIEPPRCTRQELYVDFEKIGWSTWIISPKGYHAYYCKGVCSFPLGQNQWPTNHATVQSIVHELNLSPGVKMPCCVPNKLFSINLLYYDEHENVILKQYDDMVAVSCGCN